MSSPVQRPPTKFRIEGLCGSVMLLSILGFVTSLFGTTSKADALMISSAVAFSGALIGLVILSSKE